MADTLFKLQSADQLRRSITKKQQKEIRDLYVYVYNQVQKDIARLGKKKLDKHNLVALKTEIYNMIVSLNKDIENNVITNMTSISEEVVKDVRVYLSKCGFREEDMHNAFIYVPKQVISTITSGVIYQEGWTLSKAIWGNNKHIQDSLNKIIVIDTAQGKSAFEIAKDIERYVNPNARKPSKTIQSWVYDNKGNKVKETFRFGKVDYNAQRLARTLVSHAYQQTFEVTNRYDPFIIGYKWLTSNFHGRVCPICRERAETDQYGLGTGVFPKDELPLDHPNGMCTFEAVFEKTPKEIGEMIDKWYNAPTGTYPEIDKYALTFLDKIGGTK